MKNLKVQNELNRIAQSNGGMLEPEMVVRVAKSARSILHRYFEWDDGEAAEQYRIWQARQLISVCVQVVPGTEIESKCFVSLSTDRGDGRGYRVMTEVLSNQEMRKQLLFDALSDLNHFQKKYAELRQLAGVFTEIKKLKRKAA